MKLLIACALVALVSAAPQAPAAGAGGDKHPAPTLPGGCPTYKPVASFDTQKFAGEWFVTHGAKQGVEKKETAKCLSKILTAKPDGGYEIQASGIKGNNPKKTKTFTANAVAGTPGKFSGTNEDDSTMTAEATILDTDYTTYSVVASCKTDGQHHSLLFTVDSRGKTITAENLEKAKAALKAQNINDELTAVEQSC